MRTPNHRILGISTTFIKNEKAVLGLPMRLTVSLIIGTVALVAILSYVMNPCLFPDRMIVSVNPMVNIVSGNNSTDINITIYVNETNGYPIKDANVIIKGLTGIGANHTDENGKTIIQITVKLENGVNEGYLDVSVKAACHETFSQQDMIKILRH
jgi:hypothetical protein